LLIVIVFSRSY